jgi:hypothetical protein
MTPDHWRDAIQVAGTVLCPSSLYATERSTPVEDPLATPQAKDNPARSET